MRSSEGGLFGYSEGKLHDDTEAPPPSKLSAALEKCKLEVVALAQKLSSSLEALEAKNAELREIQSDKESLEAKLDEKEKDARRVAEEHKDRLAESLRSLEAKLREKDLNDAARRIGERNAEPRASRSRSWPW